MATANGAKSPSSMGPKVLFYSILLTLQYGAQPLISKRCIGYHLLKQPMPLKISNVEFLFCNFVRLFWELRDSVSICLMLSRLFIHSFILRIVVQNCNGNLQFDFF